MIAPLFRVTTIRDVESLVARIVGSQPVIWFPAAWLHRYPASQRAGHRLAAVIQNNAVLIYSLRADGGLGILHAVIEQEPAHG